MAKILPDERGLLFADTTNSCAKDVESKADGGDDLPIMKLKGRGTGKVKRGPKKRKMEVVIPVVTQRELEVDVFT